MENDNSIVIEKDGQKVNCDIYYSFISDDTKKGYVAFSDHSKDEEGNENIYMGSFDPEVGYDTLSPVTDEKEIEMFNSVLESIKSSVMEGNHE